MRRAAAFVLRNWPLKVGAILLATVLYSGLVLGQNVRTFTGTVPVEAIRPPAGATLLSDLAPVTTIRYRASLDVGVVSPDSFSATVDLSRVPAQPGGAPVQVPITLVALDRRIQIVDYQPDSLQVELDPVAESDFPITVDLGTVPEGVNVGPPQVDPSTVTVRGASSRVASVHDVVARIQIDASALNIDRSVDLIALDSDGNQVPNVELDPDRAHVRMAVARQLANRTLPVVPQVTGSVAPGYRITSITVDPQVVTVSGEETTITQLQNAMTAPIDVTGRTSDLEAMIGYALPPGVSVTGNDQVKVVLTVAQETGTQTFPTGFRLTGTECECIYSYDKQAILVTLSGPLLALNSVDSTGCCTATLDITGLAPGSHAVALTVEPPDGLQVTAISPAEITVNIEAATPVATGLASPAPSQTP